MNLTAAEWRERLTEEEYRVTRTGGTEAPFTGSLLHVSQAGKYLCKCCGAELFSSEHKFDSGCGWPSFFAEAAAQNVAYRRDTSLGMVRVEILCRQCDAHLGHVFEDGPLPTGQRYCVNSVSMSFVAEK